MGPTPILEMVHAYGLRPRLWLLVLFNFGHIRRWDQCAVYILWQGEPVELKHCETSSSYRIFYLMKLNLRRKLKVIFNFGIWLRHMKTKKRKNLGWTSWNQFIEQEAKGRDGWQMLLCGLMPHSLEQSEWVDFIQSGTGSVARSHKNGSHKFGWLYAVREKKLQTNCQGKNIAMVLKMGLLLCWSFVWLKYVKFLFC